MWQIRTFIASSNDGDSCVERTPEASTPIKEDGRHGGVDRPGEEADDRKASGHDREGEGVKASSKNQTAEQVSVRYSMAT